MFGTRLSQEYKFALLYGGLAVLLLGGGGGVLILLQRNRVLFPEFALPLLLVATLLALFVCLTAMVAVLSTLKLPNKNLALGLPAGSVRALIALSLVLIFVLASTFLFGSLETRTTSRNFPAAQIETFSDRIVTIETTVDANGETAYTVVMARPVDKAQEDFAKQILTTISTLVVAVSGFYFGSRTASGSEPATKGKATLSIVSPKENPVALAESKGASLKVQLKVTPAGNAVRWTLEGDQDGSLTALAPDTFLYQRGSKPAEEVVLRFELVGNPKVRQELRVVKPPVG